MSDEKITVANEDELEAIETLLEISRERKISKVWCLEPNPKDDSKHYGVVIAFFGTKDEVIKMIEPFLIMALARWRKQKAADKQ